MRIFSYFLPQFHEIPENNEWWGKGFTEWVNVKAAKPLFKGHIQPKHPLNNNYYNLLNKETVIQQTSLMHKYGITGMIYYHYYFKGKLLLEKPAENLLKWKDIDQPFFFCWANHDWIRSWEGNKKLLIKQDYGDEADWERHFQYLLPFFQDERYEKKNNMPLLMIFKFDFQEKERLFLYFDKRCKDYGYDGLYLIETFGQKWGGKTFKDDFEIYKKQCSSVTKSVHTREPDTSQWAYYHLVTTDFFPRIYRRMQCELRKVFGRPYLYILNGNKLYRKMIDECAGVNGIHGLYFEWDNTPRHKKRGYVITPVKKELFFEYMNKVKNDEYIFLNAWNEWAEGMMLEPTEELGYKYLEWIKEWKDSVS